jgi:SAM-dependent methyltransferase
LTAPVPARLREEYERRYDSARGDPARSGEWRALCAEGKADHVVGLLRALPDRPGSVLEVGCGDGALLSALASRGIGSSWEGVDISQRAVEIAATRPEIDRVWHFDGESLPVANATYDLGVLSHVLEHVPEPVALLEEVARACRSVVVEVPLEDNWSASRPSAEDTRQELGHLHRFSRADVRALARRAGLELVGELADPLPAASQTFWADSPAGRVLALAKAALRRTLFVVAPHFAERAFTVHYACLLAR